jgi:hypothetical protein
MPEKSIIALGLIAVALVLLSGCASKVSETACATDSDCACGTHVQTGECFVGRAEFVNVSRQCPDFCTGIDGRRQTRCMNGTCATVRV